MSFTMFGITLLVALLFSFAVFPVQSQEDHKTTNSATPTHSLSKSITATRSSFPSATPSSSPSRSFSNSPSISRTSSESHSPSISITATRTSSTSHSASNTPSPSSSPCPVCPTPSSCPGPNIDILLAKVAKVYTNLIYPTSTEILAGILNVTDLFSPEVVGRVDPVGTFGNFKLLTEYFYALAANPQNFIASVDFIDLFGVGNEVYVRVNVFFQAVNPNTTQSFNLTQSGRYIFDENDLIETVDVIIHYLGKRSNPVENAAVYTSQQNALIEQVCYSLLILNGGSCSNPDLDPEGHYTSLTDCIEFMTGNITYGTWDDAQANSFVCRQLHTLLTFFDPVTHCPHAGKTGGGKCVDWDYEEYFAESYKKK